MAIARVNDVYRQDTNNTSPTHTITGTTTANALIITVMWESSTDTISVPAISGETVTQFTGASFTDVNLGSGRSAKIYYVKSLASGGSKVFTATLSAGHYWTVALMEISGHDTTNFDDGSGAVLTNQISANPAPTITTTVANAMIFGFIASDSSNGSVGSGYTATGASWPAFQMRNFAEYKLDAGAAGANTVPFVLTSDRWESAVVAIRPAGGGGGGGRTSKNTRGWGLGTELGMGIWMPNNL